MYTTNSTRSAVRRPLGAAYARLRVLLFAAALAFVGATSHAQPQAAQKPVGTWLIEPLYFDPLLDHGVLLPEYPVLVIRPDGEFRLFRILFDCRPYDEKGRELKEYGQRLRFLEACAALREGMRDTGFPNSHAQLSAAGRWELEEGKRLRFVVQSTGPTPDYFRDVLKNSAGMRVSREKMDLYVRDPDARQRMDAKLASEQTRMQTFYTTFYIFDGAPRESSFDAQYLRMKGPDPGDVLVYRAYRPESIDSASAAVAAFGLNGQRYFRCLVESFERAQDAPSASSGELAKFAEIARLVVGLGERRNRSEALREAKRPDEAARYWTDADETAAGRLGTTAGVHPAMIAVEKERLGAYLGCPERDRRGSR